MNGSSEVWNSLQEGLLAQLRMGSVSVPMLLLTTYAKLDLTEVEAMVLIQLTAFQERENKEFPTLEDLQSRMSIPVEQVANTLQKLMKEGYLQIDEHTDHGSGLIHERYNLEGLWQKLTAVWVMEAGSTPSNMVNRSNDKPGRAASHKASPDSAREDNVYVLFEKEFARPLTPMEMETITGWLDEDRYSLDLIIMALKEAVFAGKVHFRYIDRILLEWKRNKVYTAEQAKEFTQRFRGNGRG